MNSSHRAVVAVPLRSSGFAINLLPPCLSPSPSPSFPLSFTHVSLSLQSITYHTGKKETVYIEEALSKTINRDDLKLIVGARARMVESIYRYFNTNLSESHRAKMYICTLRDPRLKSYKMWSTRKYVSPHLDTRHDICAA